ncbi:OmpA family protein [Sphingomonas sp. 1P06PA]|uniref:OmpA family protein n=1 Tax=Sphingomonas sp. 1P06PA TaxID=554121 RepID=UPI0039A48888
MLRVLIFSMLVTPALAASPAVAQSGDDPDAVVCQLLGDCTAAPAARSSTARGFSFAKDRGKPAAPPAAAPSRRRPVATAAAPAGQYDLRVTFVSGSDEVNAGSQARIRTFATALADPRLAGRRLRIEGHTDSIGSAASNRELSERRARAVADLVTAQGVDAERLDVRGYGSDRPLPSLSPRNGANRRVVAVLIK